MKTQRFQEVNYDATTDFSDRFGKLVCYEARADNVFVGFSNFSIEKLSEFIISECKSGEK